MGLWLRNLPSLPPARRGVAEICFISPTLMRSDNPLPTTGSCIARHAGTIMHLESARRRIETVVHPRASPPNSKPLIFVYLPCASPPGVLAEAMLIMLNAVGI